MVYPIEQLSYYMPGRHHRQLQKLIPTRMEIILSKFPQSAVTKLDSASLVTNLNLVLPVIEVMRTQSMKIQANVLPNMIQISEDTTEVINDSEGLVCDACLVSWKSGKQL